MKIKTSELTGAALDWAVAKCVSADAEMRNAMGRFFAEGWPFEPSTTWAHGGPIIDREAIGVQKHFDQRHGGWHWRAAKWNRARMADDHAYGPTLLIAAMRCYVASKLGDEVEVPEELQ